MSNTISISDDGELRCSGSVRSSGSTYGTRGLTLVKMLCLSNIKRYYSTTFPYEIICIWGATFSSSSSLGNITGSN